MKYAILLVLFLQFAALQSRIVPTRVPNYEYICVLANQDIYDVKGTPCKECVIKAIEDISSSVEEQDEESIFVSEVSAVVNSCSLNYEAALKDCLKESEPFKCLENEFLRMEVVAMIGDCKVYGPLQEGEMLCPSCIHDALVETVNSADMPGRKTFLKLTEYNTLRSNMMKHCPQFFGGMEPSEGDENPSEPEE